MSKPKPATQSKLDQVLVQADQIQQAAKPLTWLDRLSSEDRELCEATKKTHQEQKGRYRAAYLAEALATQIKTNASVRTIRYFLGDSAHG